MSDETPEVIPAAKPSREPAPVVEPGLLHVTAQQFCQRKSMADGRVELLNAFFRQETTAGRIKDSAEAYDVRLTEFADLPA